MKLLADLILNGAETMKMSENIKKNFDNPERNNGELRADKFKGFITDEWNVQKNKRGTRYIFAWRRICRRGDSISQKNY